MRTTIIAPLTGRLSFRAVAEGLFRRLSGYLEDLWALSGRVNLPADLPTRHRVQLQRGAVHTVPRTSRLVAMEIASGVVWLTESPARGDVILQPGDRHRLLGSRAVVLEALEQAEVLFHEDP